MSPRSVTVAAVDLGASSGRVMVGRVDADHLELLEAHRFPNQPVQVGQTLHWDILSLYSGVLEGLRAAGRGHTLDGVGIDSWAIDYGLLDATGALLGNPVSYRDGRTAGVMPRVLSTVGAEAVYATTGLQNLPFNTVYQLVSAVGTPMLAAARQLLLIPDLLAYWLTGVAGAEVTNASTTQLLDARTRGWATPLMDQLGIPAGIFPPLCDPGTRIGTLLPSLAGLDPAPVFAVGSHDTASAVVGVPARDERFAYISCGTWSLVGVELPAPVLTEASRRANFTNELGVDGTVRYLRNVMGLWLLQESLRSWGDPDLPALLAGAAAAPPFVSLVDPDRPEFLPPGDLPARLADACRRTGQPAPDSPAATVRCVLESLALAHRRAIRDAQELSGRSVSVVHIVGGGARNALLCQLTADACGLPVIAGPVEATAWGNALVQARALGAVSGGLGELRALLARHTPTVRYEPAGDRAAWAAAESRIWPAHSIA
jgi:rhamnulokinase